MVRIHVISARDQNLTLSLTMCAIGSGIFGISRLGLGLQYKRRAARQKPQKAAQTYNAQPKALCNNKVRKKRKRQPNPYKQVCKAHRSKHHEHLHKHKQEVYDVIDSMAVGEVAKLKQRVGK
ncbi:MAG: hypothetical protein QXL94_07250 [Candidatus Parvarchaeum sp.]